MIVLCLASKEMLSEIFFYNSHHPFLGYPFWEITCIILMKSFFLSYVVIPCKMLVLSGRISKKISFQGIFIIFWFTCILISCNWWPGVFFSLSKVESKDIALSIMIYAPAYTINIWISHLDGNIILSLLIWWFKYAIFFMLSIISTRRKNAGAMCC